MTYKFWEDPYHLPKNKRHYSHRPDLDAKAERLVEKRAEEERCELEQLRGEVRRRSKEAQKRLRLSRQRMDKRYNITCDREDVESEWENIHLPYKNQQFYRRTGFLWSDMVHVPQARLHLVATPKVLRGDAWAAKQITKRKAKEVDKEIASEEEKQSRIASIRADFAGQMLSNDRRNSGPSKAEDSGLSPREEPVHARNIEKQLKEERSMRKQQAIDRFHFNSADFNGLLHNDVYVMDRISRNPVYQAGDNRKLLATFEETRKPKRRPHSAPFPRKSRGGDGLGPTNTPGQCAKTRPSSSTPILKNRSRPKLKSTRIGPENSLFVRTEIDDFEARLEMFQRSRANTFPRQRTS